MSQIKLELYVNANPNMPPHLIWFDVPDQYDYVRIMWPDDSEAHKDVAELIYERKYLGTSREAINNARL